MKDQNNIIRFVLTFFLGWIGSLIINHTNLKPEGYTSRTLAYFFLPNRCAEKYRLQKRLILKK